MFAPERSATAVVRAELCPSCGFPVHPGQPVLHVHTGTVYDGEGMTDLTPAFHRTCGAAHLIALGRTKTETQRTITHAPLIERKAS